MYPFVFAAVAMALYLLATVFQRPGPAPILATTLWAAYAVYEYYVANGTLCDANCNIRVDLLLFWPVLVSAAYLALQSAPRPGAVSLLYVVCLGLLACGLAAFGYTAPAVVAGAGALISAGYGIKLMVMATRRHL